MAEDCTVSYEKTDTSQEQTEKEAWRGSESAESRIRVIHVCIHLFGRKCTEYVLIFKTLLIKSLRSSDLNYGWKQMLNCYSSIPLQRRKQVVLPLRLFLLIGPQVHPADYQEGPPFFLRFCVFSSFFLLCSSTNRKSNLCVSQTKTKNKVKSRSLI